LREPPTVRVGATQAVVDPADLVGERLQVVARTEQLELADVE